MLVWIVVGDLALAALNIFIWMLGGPLAYLNLAAASVAFVVGVYITIWELVP